MAIELFPATHIALSTVRLVATGGREGSVGTGYFYIFETPHGRVDAVVTNKHVLGDATHLSMVLSLKPKGVAVRHDGGCDGEKIVPVEIPSFRQYVIDHPDPQVDLCIILIGPVLNNLPSGFEPKASFLHKKWQLESDEMQFIRPVEPIVMVGYPSGLWDQVNNRPITRQGLTASHPLLNWNNKREFVIDAACFPGSSGSPVFLYQDGMYRKGERNYSAGSSATLLGTLWGGPKVTNEGRLEPRPIPTSAKDVPVLETMMNLGFVIHASAIDDFMPLIDRKLRPNFGRKS